MSLSEFLSSLQIAKKELLKPERLSPSELSSCCARFSEAVKRESESLRGLDPSAPLFSEEFYSTQIVEAAARAFSSVSQSPRTAGFPTGLIGVTVRSSFFLRLAAERLARAWVNGNCVLLKVSADQIRLAKRLGELAVQAGFPEGVFQILPESAETDPLFFQHPGIRAISCFDPSFRAEQMGSLESLLEKKWQVHRGGKSTALVLADADLEEAADGILRAVREGWGTSSWNVSRVFVIESVEKDFLAVLQKKAVQLQAEPPIRERKRSQEWIQALQKEQARALDWLSPITFLQNVSNCTEAHQTELGAPVVFLMSVKYPHEMQKWVNNLPNSMGVQIWASDEKIEKLAVKLETARVWRRGWIDSDTSLMYGVKSSVFGDDGNRISGDFFSEGRIFDEEPSKTSH
jgi:acyl-CoA reductase-like NAD-dependent aldehyde dehydrogenase